jgi:RAQPRD family integrative conjugative element protein
MLQRCKTTHLRPVLFAIALAVFLSIDVPSMAADSSEEARLAAIVRQLDMLERMAQQSAETSPVDGQRYRFDYSRLYADIARIRSGIKDYLSPSRAQPRDPERLSGEYRRDQEFTRER